MRVGIRDAPVVFVFKFVFGRARSGIAAQPELLDEHFPFRIGREFLKRGPRFIGNDVDHVLIEPFRETGLRRARGVRRLRFPGGKSDRGAAIRTTVAKKNVPALLGFWDRADDEFLNRDYGPVYSERLSGSY
jgi:hypothetical protein